MVSYCITCHNRLWQLRLTLPANLQHTQSDVSITLLDYHSTDGLKEYISKYEKYIADNRLNYYKLVTPCSRFDMSYAKNVVHLLAKGKVLFNLDADNFIGITVSELRKLRTNQILLPKLVTGTATGRCGRIGYHKSTFIQLRGYEESIKGLSGDDTEFLRRTNELDLIYSDDLSIPIPNPQADKLKSPLILSDIPSTPNRNGFGRAIVEDYYGVISTTHEST